jgi:Trehalase
MIFSTDDGDIQSVFDWAHACANSFRATPQREDPVGPWYEAALPGRSAFCVRDTAHQCIGAELLGMHAENQNMLRRFAAGLSESKDYCSFWEIDRTGGPAPVDYDNDTDFWYCLPANMDMIWACIRLWKLTGDTDLLMSTDFGRFADATLSSYLEKWQLTPEQILDRPARMHTGKGRFGESRGIASYDEARDGISVGSDLVASLFAAFNGMADWHRFRHDLERAAHCAQMAARYKAILNTAFWNEPGCRFFDYRLEDGTMADGSSAGGLFPVWFGAVERPEQSRIALSTITTTQIEILSYAPALFWSAGFAAEAREKLLAIAASERRDYPEASFGAIEGIVCGLMGLQPDASQQRIATRSGLTSDSGFAEISDLRVFPGRVSVRHQGTHASWFTNSANIPVMWRAEFPGTATMANIDGNRVRLVQSNTCADVSICYTEILVSPGTTAAAELC